MSSFKRTSRALRASKIALFVLWAAFAALAYNIYSELQELSLIGHLEELEETLPPGDDYDDETYARIEANEDRQTYAMIGHLTALSLSMVFLLLWVSRTNRACRELGATELRFTPGWAWGYWLIPILNLFRPFQIITELWETTDPDGKSNSLLGWWWAAWIVSGFASRFVGNVGPDATLAEYRHADHMLLGSHGLDIIGLALTIVVVSKLTAKLRAFHDRVALATVRVVSEEAGEG